MVRYGLPGMLQEDLLPYLRQPVIYLECCAPTANDQLKLDYFFPFVSWPAALAQLRICVEAKLWTMKVPNSFFSLLFILYLSSHSWESFQYCCRLSV